MPQLVERGNTPPSQKDNKEDRDMNNAEMWASVMCRLDTMLKQQNEALQDIKEEIKATNLGFVNDISQIRGDINDIQHKLQDRDAEWDDLGLFKQGVLD